MQGSENFWDENYLTILSEMRTVLAEKRTCLAELLNRAGTEINVILGLCIGHDMLFIMNSKAPVTTLIVKDRLLGHNPVIGLYSSYHKKIIESQKRI
jgi:uncharacterized metal-binding protein